MSSGGGVRKLAELTRATFVNGRWRKPVLTARAVNRLRKEAAVAGVTDFEFPRPPVREMAPREKGHKHEREKVKRVELTAKKVAAMPQLVAEHRQQVRQKRRLEKIGRMLVPPFPMPPKQEPGK